MFLRELAREGEGGQKYHPLTWNSNLWKVAVYADVAKWGGEGWEGHTGGVICAGYVLALSET